MPLKLQTMQTPNRMPAAMRPGGGATGAAVELAAKVMVWGTDRLVEYRLRKEIEALEPQVRLLQPSCGGVLVRAVYKEAAHQNYDLAFTPRYLRGVEVVGAGLDRDTTVRRYLVSPAPLPAAQRSFWFGDANFAEQLIWVTAP